MTIALWHWWNSTETLSKILNYAAVLVTVLGVTTLTLKLRYDHLKKRADAPRQLTQEQRSNFIKSLADTPKGAISVSYSVSNTDTVNFAGQIHSLLKEAGFTVP